MSRVQVLRCDGPTCSEQIEDEHSEMRIPDDWIIVAGDWPEVHGLQHKQHFHSMACLAEWAAKQVGKSLVKFEINATYPNVAAAAARWPGFQVESTPGKLDISKPLGCWPHDTGDWSHME